MRCPSIVDVRAVVDSARSNQACVNIRGTETYVPSRAQWSIISPFTRIKAAWLVFTGRADALTWPGQ